MDAHPFRLTETRGRVASFSGSDSFYDLYGNYQTSYVVDYGASFSAATACSGYSGQIPKCTGASSYDCGFTGCASLTSKVHVATLDDAGTCYAYVGYDSSYTSNIDSNTYMLSAFARVNITNEGSIPWPPSPWFTYPSYPFNYAFNAYGTTVSANIYAGTVGWYFYSQYSVSGNDPCHTDYVGESNASYGDGTWFGPYTLDGPFPTLGVLGADYVGIVKRGLPGGYLYPTWHRAVITTDAFSCIPCQGSNYNLAIYAAEDYP